MGKFNDDDDPFSEKQEVETAQQVLADFPIEAKSESKHAQRRKKKKTATVTCEGDAEPTLDDL